MAKLTNRAAKAAADAVADLSEVGTTFSSGRIVFYDGTEPADADTALSGNTVLSTVVLLNPAFGNASDASPGADVAALTPISDTNIATGGTVSFARWKDRDGDDIGQYTVGVTGSGKDIIVNSVTFVAGETLEVLSFVPHFPES